MPCYMCKTKTGPFQRLEVARLRFIRKAQPLFRDDSYLCPKCFTQFETIYKSKSKSKSRNDSSSSRTTISNASTRTVSTNTQDHNSKNSSQYNSNVTAVQKADGNNNSNSDNPSVASVASVIHFNSRSLDSPTPSSNDTMDRIVQMAPDFLSLRDSSRKTARNPELNVARQGAEAAVESALKRKRKLQTGKTPPAIPPPARRDLMQVVDEETSEDEDIASQLSPNDLAHVRPIVRKRKEPVVQQFDDIMDLYIARTSGG